MRTSVQTHYTSPKNIPTKTLCEGQVGSNRLLGVYFIFIFWRVWPYCNNMLGYLLPIPYTTVRLRMMHLVFTFDFQSLTQPYDCTWCISFLLLSFNPLHSRTIAHDPSCFWSSSFATPISSHTYRLSVPLIRFTLLKCKRPTSCASAVWPTVLDYFIILSSTPKSIPAKTPTEGQIRC